MPAGLKRHGTSSARRRPATHTIAKRSSLGATCRRAKRSCPRPPARPPGVDLGGPGSPSRLRSSAVPTCMRWGRERATLALAALAALLLGPQAHLSHARRHEVVLCDLHLLLQIVPRQPDHLHRQARDTRPRPMQGMPCRSISPRDWSSPSVFLLAPARTHTT